MSSTLSKVVAVIILAVAAWFVHGILRDSQADSAREKQRATQKQKSQEAILLAAKQYGAILGWEEKFSRTLSDSFSLRLEEAIMPSGGMPIVTDGFVEDVARRGDKYFLHLSNLNVGSISIRFILECDLASAKTILEKKESFLDISVIAQIESVEKAQFSIVSGIKNNEDPAPVEIDSSTMFVAHGRCFYIIPKSSENGME
jgi:hypothetical protein